MHRRDVDVTNKVCSCAVPWIEFAEEIGFLREAHELYGFLYPLRVVSDDAGFCSWRYHRIAAEFCFPGSGGSGTSYARFVGQLYILSKQTAIKFAEHGVMQTAQSTL